MLIDSIMGPCFLTVVSFPLPQGDQGQVALQGLLSDRDTEILNLKEQLKTAFKASSDASDPTKHRETANQVREQSSFITNKILSLLVSCKGYRV